jgi:tetratricopeptide (TPR) repeat protein
VLAIDDPYQLGSPLEPATRWREALDAVADLRQDGFGQRLPLIVCCGPTEQANQLAEDFPDDLAVTVEIIGNESAEDYEQLRGWFTARTGDTPPPVAAQNLLMVQLFFEWHHRHPLTEFARRFRVRLTAMDPSGRIADVVTRILTLNRLYAGYPAAAFHDLLEPCLRDKLATLQREAHLQTHGDTAGREIWIAHPHLANIIYETWFPPDTRRHERMDHLRSILQDCHRYGADGATRTVPLWALTQIFKDRTGNLAARIDPEDAHSVVATWWTTRVKQTGPVPLDELPVWLELAASPRAAHWSPHPVTVALQAVPTATPDTAGLRETCHKLLQHAPTAPGVNDAVIGLLNGQMPWHEWLHVAIDALRRLEDPRLEPTARHLLTVTRDPTRAADIAWTLGGILYLAGRYDEAMSVLDDALARDNVPPIWQARLSAWRARVLPLTGRRHDGERLARVTLAEGRRLGDHITIGHSLHALYLLATYEDGLNYVNEALDVIADRPDTVGLRVALLTNRASNLHCLGQHQAAEESMREARTLAEQTGAWSLPTVRVQLAEQYIKIGRWDEAQAELRLVTGKLSLFERVTKLGGLAFIAAHREDRTACARALTESRALPELMSFMRGNAALLLMAQAVDAEQRHGPRQAADILADTVATEEGTDLFDRNLWLPDLVRLALAVHDPDLARAAVAAAETDAAAEPIPQRTTAARHARAVLHADPAELLLIAETYRTHGNPLAGGQAYEQAAVHLAQSHGQQAARTALAHAITAYRHLNATWDERRANNRLHPYNPHKLTR